MRDAISNTSPLLFLHRLGALDWLGQLFASVWVPNAVLAELAEGERRGHEVPDVSASTWAKIVDPTHMPSEWLALDLGKGELAAMALAIENPDRVVLLDDALARRTALAAGLTVRGTLSLILEAKDVGLVDRVAPFVDKLALSGMWLSTDVRRRILQLAGE